MLRKLIHIKNVGKFRNSCARGDVEFRKMTLIYAENGRGKTTLCAILRSLLLGKPEPIIERQTLGTSNPPEVNILVDSANAIFRDGSWNALYPDISIFDSTFVHENVYAGDFIEHEHKKNLYLVIVGEKGVALARKVDELDGKIREANKNISDTEAELRKYVPTDISLEDFVRLPAEVSIDEKISSKEAEVTRLERADEIASTNQLERLSIRSLPNNLNSLLSKELESVSEHLDESGESWITHGMNYLRNENCPFCGQDTSGVELVGAYRTHFSESYRDLKEEITDLKQNIEERFGDSSLVEIQRIITENQRLVSLRDEALKLVEKKSNSPLEVVPFSDELRAAIKDIDDIQKIIMKYNLEISTINTNIESQKSSTVTGDLEGARTEFIILQSTKLRHEPDPSEACRMYNHALNLKLKFYS